MNHSLDLSHLAPIAQSAIFLPDSERIARIRADRWIGYPKARQALDQLEDLFTLPERQRMQNMLLISPTNNGKSMIIEKFRRQHLPYVSEDGEKEIIPVLTIQMPSDPSISRFYTLLLYALNSPMKPRMRIADLEVLALRLMKLTQVKMLIIDELHNILAGKYTLRSEFLNLLRFLGNELRIPIVGVGTEDAYRAIRIDDQLENRFKPFILSRWCNNEELLSLLGSFAASFPLKRPSVLHHPDIAQYIISKTGGTIGEISTLLVRAATIAIHSGEEEINSKTLSNAEYDSPSERRKKFERELK